jgi:hypothetical protein
MVVGVAQEVGQTLGDCFINTVVADEDARHLTWTQRTYGEIGLVAL